MLGLEECVRLFVELGSYIDWTATVVEVVTIFLIRVKVSGYLKRLVFISFKMYG